MVVRTSYVTGAPINFKPVCEISQ